MPRPLPSPRILTLLCALVGPVLAALPALAQPAPAARPCEAGAADRCYFDFAPTGAGGGRLHFYASLRPGIDRAAPVAALVALHGHSRDANRSFDAALQAARLGGTLATTLVVAPLFQVDPAQAAKCRTAGVPAAQPGDLLWACNDWSDGGAADAGRGPGAFAAMDTLLADLLRLWPSLRSITLAGFSAGAQFVQRYAGFADPRLPPAVHLRFVVADPGSWLYFDALRPQPMRAGRPVDWAECAESAEGADPLGRCTLVFNPPPADCPAADRWKYGTQGLPATLGRSAAEARARYTQADIRYLEGGLDRDAARGNAARLLDHACAAEAQGPFRLQRGLAYAAYDRERLAPGLHRSVVSVPGCAHSVACVFPAPAAREALLGSAGTAR